MRTEPLHLRDDKHILDPEATNGQASYVMYCGVKLKDADGSGNVWLYGSQAKQNAVRSIFICEKCMHEMRASEAVRMLENEKSVS